MKITVILLLTILILGSYLNVIAADYDKLELTDGTVYENVTVSKVDPDGLRVSYDGGVGKLPFSKLSKEIQEKYGYDPEKEAKYKASKESAIKTEEKAKADAAKRKKQLENPFILNLLIIRKESDGSVYASLRGYHDLKKVASYNLNFMPSIYISGFRGECTVDKSINIIAARDGIRTVAPGKDYEQWVYLDSYDNLSKYTNITYW